MQNKWHDIFLLENNIPISVSRSKFILVFINASYHANLGAEKNLAGSSLYSLRHIFQKVLNS